MIIPVIDMIILFKNHAQRSRLTMNFTTDASDTSTTRAVKRSNDGSTHCTCRGSCSTKMCGCVKSDKGCGGGCRCQSELCKNRRASSDSEDKENHPSSTEFSLETTPPPSYFDKRDHLDATYIKKTKIYFFPQDATNGEVKKNT